MDCSPDLELDERASIQGLSKSYEGHRHPGSAACHSIHVWQCGHIACHSQHSLDTLFLLMSIDAYAQAGQRGRQRERLIPFIPPISCATRYQGDTLTSPRSDRGRFSRSVSQDMQ